MDYEKLSTDSLKLVPFSEKTKLLFGAGAWHTFNIPYSNINSITLSDGPCGLRKVKEGSMLDIAESFPATCFPAPCLTACSWDQELMEEYGKVFAKEAIKSEVNVILAPGVNIKRSPLCGRNFEYLSEDPLLAGKMGAAFIRGVQSKGVGATLKHFAANNQEYRRFTTDSIIDKRALREIYLKPFEIVVKESDPYAIMASYNLINGVYACSNKWLLNDVLRKEWGYSGVVMSDWGACSHPVLDHASTLDLEMPCYSNRSKQIVKAVKKGHLSKTTVEDEAKRVATLYFKTNNPLKEPYEYCEGHDFARRLGNNSAVLLENKRGLLPLKNYDGCALIGALADKPRYQGAGSSQVNPINLVSFLSLFPDKDAYCPGYSLIKFDDTSLEEEAIELAKSKETIILFLGLPESSESEGFDRTSLSLPSNQLHLVKELSLLNKHLVVVLCLGAPVKIPFKEYAESILLLYLSGEVVGEVADDLLLGKANPSGRLAETWPVSNCDLSNNDFYPGKDDKACYWESIFVGYRYYQTLDIKTSYPFGYGLSYTSFEWSTPTFSNLKIAGESKIEIKLTVKNTGLREGSDVVELFSSPLNRLSYHPKKELIAFSKVSLNPGEEKVVSFIIKAADFAYFDTNASMFATENGKYCVEITRSCEDIVYSKEIEIFTGHAGISNKDKLPSFYGLGGDKFALSSSEGSYLLPEAFKEKKKSRSYSMNTTIVEIRDTFVGKLILKEAEKKASGISDPCSKKMIIESVLDCPIRFLAVSAVNERIALAIVSLANKRPLQALWRLLFGHFE